nr:hypothetical protein [Tanacetum cinerariifolium]
MYTPPDYQLTDEEENQEGDDEVKEENVQANQVMEDTHVTLTTVPPIVQQQSSFVSSDTVSKFINPSPDIVTNNKLREKAQAVNQEFLNQVDSTMKAIIKEQVQVQVSKIMPMTKNFTFRIRIKEDKMKENKAVNRSDIQKNLYNTLVESYNSDKDIITSYSVVVILKRGKSAQAVEHGQTVDDLEEQTHQEFNTRNDDVTHTVNNRPPQIWITQMAQAAGTQSSFNELLATPIDFSAFIMNWLKIDNLTQEVLTDPTYDLIKGTCKSVVELEYHLEEVDSTMKAIIKEQVQVQVSKIMPMTKNFTFRIRIKEDKMKENKAVNRSDIQKNLYNTLVESYNSDKDIITSYSVVVILKRGRDDQDKDEDPSARLNRGSKRSRNRRDLPRDNILDIIEVLRYEKKSKSENKGKVQTEMELILEQTQQGISYKVSISTEGVEYLKGKVKIKGEKRSPPYT